MFTVTRHLGEWLRPFNRRVWVKTAAVFVWDRVAGRAEQHAIRIEFPESVDPDLITVRWVDGPAWDALPEEKP